MSGIESRLTLKGLAVLIAFSTTLGIAMLVLGWHLSDIGVLSNVIGSENNLEAEIGNAIDVPWSINLILNTPISVFLSIIENILLWIGVLILYLVIRYGWFFCFGFSALCIYEFPERLKEMRSRV